MSAIKIISLESFKGRRWTKPHGLRFAARDMFVPLVLKELAFALREMPLCFVRVADVLQPVGLIGVTEGENLFVGPDASWLGEYVPLAYQHYPFLLSKLQSGNEALAIWDDPAVMTDTGDRFFDDAGKPMPVIQDTFNKLIEHAQHVKLTRAAAAALAEHDVLEPWPLTVQSGQTSKVVGELYRINEERLRALPAQGLVQLRDCGALILAHAQLFSMAQVQILGTLAGKRGQTSAASGIFPGLDLSNNGNISFDNL